MLQNARGITPVEGINSALELTSQGCGKVWPHSLWTFFSWGQAADPCGDTAESLRVFCQEGSFGKWKGPVR